MQTNYNKNNNNKKPKFSSFDHGVSSSSAPGIKSEAESMKEMQTIFSLFPKGSRIREAAEKRARELRNG